MYFRSATLEDIYRHYEEPNEVEDRNTIDMVMDDNSKDGNEDFDPHITGFAYEAPQAPNSPSKSSHSAGGGGYQYTGLGAHATTGGGNYGGYPAAGIGHSSYGSSGGGGGGGGAGGHPAPYYGGISGHATYEEGTFFFNILHLVMLSWK